MGIGKTNAGGSGGLSMELLWENASPTSTFARQTISLDLTGYDACMVFFKIKTNNDIRASAYSLKNVKGFIFSDDNSGHVCNRAFTTKDYGVDFLQAYYYATYASYAENNGYQIPERIYGIKGVS